eukprot:CAMPEP_0117418458 /NCGR_PEP_ID=MMETSP0758-20121206/230_1 /TAXON_ID=63605 /ORGANISM="Percolomonas cosmopolitus, Strain AE-1 (ATCC 50343)" /LENGTH=596 /DNA_ID=CAMNT_0005198963 /DNA_START=812 /DNA_END=2602 /DNA_ORIENTATION=+
MLERGTDVVFHERLVEQGILHSIDSTFLFSFYQYRYLIYIDTQEEKKSKVYIIDLLLNVRTKVDNYIESHSNSDRITNLLLQIRFDSAKMDALNHPKYPKYITKDKTVESSQQRSPIIQKSKKKEQKKTKKKKIIKKKPIINESSTSDFTPPPPQVDDVVSTLSSETTLMDDDIPEYEFSFKSGERVKANLGGLYMPGTIIFPFLNDGVEFIRVVFDYGHQWDVTADDLVSNPPQSGLFVSTETNNTISLLFKIFGIQKKVPSFKSHIDAYRYMEKSNFYSDSIQKSALYDTYLKYICKHVSLNTPYKIIRYQQTEEHVLNRSSGVWKLNDNKKISKAMLFLPFAFLKHHVVTSTREISKVALFQNHRGVQKCNIYDVYDEFVSIELNGSKMNVSRNQLFPDIIDRLSSFPESWNLHCENPKPFQLFNDENYFLEMTNMSVTSESRSRSKKKRHSGKPISLYINEFHRLVKRHDTSLCRKLLANFKRQASIEHDPIKLSTIQEGDCFLLADQKNTIVKVFSVEESLVRYKQFDHPSIVNACTSVEPLRRVQLHDWCAVAIKLIEDEHLIKLNRARNAEELTKSMYSGSPAKKKAIF